MAQSQIPSPRPSSTGPEGREGIGKNPRSLLFFEAVVVVVVVASSLTSTLE